MHDTISILKIRDNKENEPFLTKTFFLNQTINSKIMFAHTFKKLQMTS